MDPFATLGLEPCFEIDPQQLEQRYRDLQRVLHPDRHAGAPPAQRRVAVGRAVEVNEAYRLLRDDLERATALLELHGVTTGERAPTPADPELLMEMMELREALAEARTSGDLETVGRLRARVERMQLSARDSVAKGFAAGADGGIEGVAELVGRMRYYRRFLEEVADIEDQALDGMP